MGDNLIHHRYLPYSVEEVERHLAEGLRTNIREGAKYFSKSIDRYKRYVDDPLAFGVDARKSTRIARQFEKDEKFWTAACLIGLEKENSAEVWIKLLRKAFRNEDPPNFSCGKRWNQLIPDAPKIRLEVPLPSPPLYLEWLKEHVSLRNLVPYVLEQASHPGVRLEGFTHADAVVVCETTGFSVVIEAKATSDISHGVSFDLMRNQIARIVDAMLERPEMGHRPPLSKRDPDSTVFVLLTPRMFQEKPTSRFYGWLMDDYRTNWHSLKRDLPHRADKVDWARLAGRIGWLTWEDCNDVLPKACPWLVKH
ncbi:MAG TPA: hypothetical protein VKT27_08225 [Candidatus Binataceae bacterium]|nr:hypothetical protein [Candidatus Binataceae bacterium]